MIRPAKKTDSLSLAKLHAETLTTSFLAGLGLRFLSNLYQFIISEEKVWVYEEEKEIKGFVSFSRNSAGMMKRLLIHCPACILLLVFKLIERPNYIQRFWETFRIPFQSNTSAEAESTIILPSSELLSISVSPNCQTSRIGSQLVKTMEEYLQQNRILSYKVVAGEVLVGANKFYLKNGFVLATQIRLHGNSLSNVYVKEIRLIALLPSQ